MSGKPKATGFEGALTELEELVARMEAGHLPLDEALRSFERGVQLTRQCQSELQAAQQRVQVLTQRAEGAVMEPFAGDSTADAADLEP